MKLPVIVLLQGLWQRQIKNNVHVRYQISESLLRSLILGYFLNIRIIPSQLWESSIPLYHSLKEKSLDS